jgi:predicted RNase H-like HicB family nuclease
MNSARYRILDDGSYFGEIPDLPGVWSSEPSLEECRVVLQEVLEGWLVLKLRDNDLIPPIGQINLTTEAA